MHFGIIHMNKKLKLGIQALTILSFSFIIDCKNQRNKVEFLNPTNDNKVLKGEKVQVRLKFPEEAVDSVVYSVDGDIFDRKTDTTAVVFDTGPHSYGNKRLSAKVYSGGKEDIAYSEVLVVPPAPKQYAFEVVSTYPHDQGAFTQGLYYENGTLF